MRTKTIEDFHSGDLSAAITVREARLVDGMERGRLIGQAFEQPRPNDLQQTVQVVIWPNLVAGTLSAEIAQNGQALKWPDFETLLELPEQLVQQWLEAVYELNPHWSPAETADSNDAASAEKKGN